MATARKPPSKPRRAPATQPVTDDGVRGAVQALGLILACRAKAAQEDPEAEAVLADVCKRLAGLVHGRAKQLEDRQFALCKERLEAMYRAAPARFETEAARKEAEERLVEAMFPFGRRLTTRMRRKWTLSKTEIARKRMKEPGIAKSLPDLAAAALADMAGVGTRTIWNWKKKGLASEDAPLLELFGVDADAASVVAALAGVLPRITGVTGDALRRRALRRARPPVEDWDG